jgi:hypothetical protein
MMDEPMSYFRAYLVKEARQLGRWALDAAAAGKEPHVAVVQAAGQAKMLENVIGQLDDMNRDPRTWAVKRGLIIAEARADVTALEEET